MDNVSQDLRSIYMDYISSLNAKNYGQLSHYVHRDVVHNGKKLGVNGYRKLIQDSFESYTWLHFNVAMLVVDESQQSVASILVLKGSDPRAIGVPREHVFYSFQDGKISEVWSMLEGVEP
jgi:predicted ester cyclase